MKYRTEQENFWVGKFGQEYMERNGFSLHFYSKVIAWSQILKRINSIQSVKEFGCNIGLNLSAINKLKPNIHLSGIEINPDAAKRASELNIADIQVGTILDEMPHDPVDLTFTFGVLIHIEPNHLQTVYKNLVNNSKKYVLVVEYFNPTPTTHVYRGYSNKLFKRDFAGELIDGFNLKLVDYSFIYSRDNVAPSDNFTWFLMEK